LVRSVLQDQDWVEVIHSHRAKTWWAVIEARGLSSAASAANAAIAHMHDWMLSFAP